jgi:hypothetical protein
VESQERSRLIHWITGSSCLAYDRQLVWSELYTICGRVPREKTYFYAVTRLRKDGFLIRQKQVRLEYFGLGPIVRDNIPVSGDRDRRDPVAFEAAMEAG